MRGIPSYSAGWFALLVAAATTGAGTPAQAQAAATTASRADTAVEAKIGALSTSLDETRTELAESRAEIKELRALLESVSQKLDTLETKPDFGQAVAAIEDTGVRKPTQGARPAVITQDDWDVLNSRLEEQQQVKVESGSKFPLRLSGIFLMNTLVSSGRLDDFDVPSIALPSSNSSGSTGFSLRQSIIGVEGRGPRVFGAETSADLQADFFGGAPYGYGSSGLGLMRLRMARMRVDWKHVSVIGGVDTPFFSPDSPTSYLTVAAPAFSGSGNLWTWSPTIRVERRFDTRVTQLKAEAGVIDVPSYVTSLSGARLPAPGEISRQPAYSLRISANQGSQDRPISLGLAGIYLSQRFAGPTDISGGGGSVDGRFPLLARTEFSGELFAGKGLDGFGAAPVPAVTPTTYLQYVTTTASLLARIGTYGGWSQLKFQVSSRGEVNFAVGAVSRDANAFRAAAQTDSIVRGLAFKNESMLVNYVYRPRSDLVFSGEYRRFRTYQINGTVAEAGQTGLTAGFIF